MRSNEAKPALPGSADGFWTDGVSDGFYDEWPVDGFYGAIGYQPEPKPLRRAAPTLESAPGRGSAVRGAWTDTSARGAWTDSSNRGAYTLNDAYILEPKP